MEWKLHVKKNNLDNEYSKILAYFQISVISLITLGIGLSVFFLQANNIEAIFRTSLLTLSIGASMFFLFRNKLSDISLEISRLG